MSLSQKTQVTPPVLETDPKLIDFASILQRNLQTLFLAGHLHVGINGVVVANPTSNQGAVGDILIGVVSGTAYLFIKTDKATWWKSPGFTQL